MALQLHGWTAGIQHIPCNSDKTQEAAWQSLHDQHLQDRGSSQKDKQTKMLHFNPLHSRKVYKINAQELRDGGELETNSGCWKQGWWGSELAIVAQMAVGTAKTQTNDLASRAGFCSCPKGQANLLLCKKPCLQANTWTTSHSFDMHVLESMFIFLWLPGLRSLGQRRNSKQPEGETANNMLYFVCSTSCDPRDLSF